jgi:hypothetical protein
MDLRMCVWTTIRIYVLLLLLLLLLLLIFQTVTPFYEYMYI